MTDPMVLLLERLHAAGVADVVVVEPATGGLAATAGIARRSDVAEMLLASAIKAERVPAGPGSR